MAIDEFGQLIHLPIGNVRCAPQHDDTSDEETIDPQKPNPTYYGHPTMTRDLTKVVVVEYLGGHANCKATGLYNKHRKYSEQWNPWHAVQSAHYIQQVQSFHQQTKMWIDQHLSGGLDNFNIESFQSANAL